MNAADGAQRPGADPAHYASLRAALRDDLIYIAEQGGWKDIRFVSRVYQRAAKRHERLAGAHLAAFDRACEWAEMGRMPAADPVAGLGPFRAADRETALRS